MGNQTQQQQMELLQQEQAKQAADIQQQALDKQAATKK
jgi:hypothetical protein